MSRSLMAACSFVLALTLASSAHAANKGRLTVSSLPAGPNHSGTYDLVNSEIEFGQGGTCDVTLETMLGEVGPRLVHDMADTIDEVKIELLGGKLGNSIFYRATLSDVQVVKVTSRTLWGSAFEDIALAPAQVRWQTWEERPDGSSRPGAEVTVTCSPHR